MKILSLSTLILTLVFTLPALAANPKSAEEITAEDNSYHLIQQARKYLRAGESGEAQNILRKAVAIAPKYAEAHERMADALFLDHKFKQALTECNTAIALKKDFIDAYLRRASIFESLNQPNKALADLNFVITTVPSRTKSYIARAGLYEGLQQWSKAIDDLHTFQKLAKPADPLLPTTYILASKYYQKLGKGALARKELGNLISKSADSADGYRLRGDSFAEDHMVKEAIADYKKALQMEPDDEHCQNALRKLQASQPEKRV